MEHRCRRGDRCPDFETINGQKFGRAINASEGLCDTCERHVLRAIRSLPIDYTELNALLGKGKTVGGEPIRMTKELPVPVRLHIEATQREMVDEAVRWASSVAQVQRITFTPRGGVRPGWLLDKACALLTSSLAVLLALREEKHRLWVDGRQEIVVRDGLDGALELLRLHQKARTRTGKTRLTIKLPVPCPRCDAMSLEREDGDDHIDCRSCERHYTWEEYEKLCLILIDWPRDKVRV